MAKEIIYLLGCGKQKQAHQAWTGPAKDLYTGSLFLSKRRFAERVRARWFIVSALHGLMVPEQHSCPYDFTVSQLKGPARNRWAMETSLRLLDLLCYSTSHGRWTADPSDFVIHLHMGKDYADPIEMAIRTAGFSNVIMPVEGLGQGEQMKWYSEPRNIMGGLVSLDRSNDE